MAIVIIEDKAKSKDCFKVKCPTCGRELRYNRLDVRSHRKWPNGFIYCPGCKAPIGHNEANFYATAEQIAKQDREKALKDKENYLKNSDLLKNEILYFTRCRKIAILIVVPIFLLLFIVSMILMAQGFVGWAYPIISVIMLLTMMMTLILVFNGLIKRRKIQIEKNNQNIFKR